MTVTDACSFEISAEEKKVGEEEGKGELPLRRPFAVSPQQKRLHVPQIDAIVYTLDLTEPTKADSVTLKSVARGIQCVWWGEVVEYYYYSKKSVDPIIITILIPTLMVRTFRNAACIEQLIHVFPTQLVALGVARSLLKCGSFLKNSPGSLTTAVTKQQ